MSDGALGEGGGQPASAPAPTPSAAAIPVHPKTDSTTRSGLASPGDESAMYLTADPVTSKGSNDLHKEEPTGQATVDALNEVGLVDFLRHDPRPTFILDLSIVAEGGSILQPVFCNPALLSAEGGSLLTLVSGKDNLDVPGPYSLRAYSRFRRWISGKETGTKPDGFSYDDMLWTKVIVKDRWSVVSGMKDHPRSDFGMSDISPVPTRTDNSGMGTPNEPERENLPHRRLSYNSDRRTHSHDDLSTAPQRAVRAEETMSQLPRWDPITGDGADDEGRPGFDWTSNYPPPDMPAHIKFVRSVDWASTKLGPMHNWSLSLRIMCNLIMSDTKPAVLFWGDEVIMIYNEAYIELLGNLHPMCMGACAAVALHDIWDHFKPFIDKNRLVGEAVQERDLPIFLLRSSILEECYFSFSFLPVPDEKGTTIGHYQPVTETTRQVISERRLSTLLKLSEETARARTMDSYWRLVLQALAMNDKDIPFALLYAVEDDGDSSGGMSTSSATSGAVKQCILKGCLGVSEGHPAAPARLDFNQNAEGFMPYFREAMKSRTQTKLDLDIDVLTNGLLDGIQWRGFGDPCRSLVICPITPTTSTNVLGFLAVGLNPRRPYDQDYQQFMGVTSRLLATSLASVVLHEEEIRQRERVISQAEIIKSRLAEQLTISQKEVERNEKKFQRLAERADIAIFIVGSDGYYTYRNPSWFDIFQVPESDLGIREVWEQLCWPDDMARCEKFFAKLMIERTPVVFELRLKRLWKPPRDVVDADGGHAEHSVWILCSAYPDLSDSGEVQEIVGCVTDISRQKWGEGLQKQRTDDALQSKTQLESFIDTTSHEMRNPLSAIIQCADGIITSHSSYMSSASDITDAYRKLLETGVDAAQTIVQCSQHMKCIVDDVLTMSKLDSSLLTMTPVDAQPELITRHAVKMFEAEAKAADIGLHFVMEPSCRQLGLDWVSLDPTRLLQILINLITNAIKFTRLEQKRTITVSIGACRDRPRTCTVGNVEYIRTAAVAEATSLVADWTKGENVFIQFNVQDTGRGLSNDEKDLLFARFSQASPRTHINYGGSGLGLFISRRLTEMQGGAIGFSSEANSGSTFSFYIKARRIQQSPTGTTQVPDLMTGLRSEKPSPVKAPRGRETTSSPCRPVERPVELQRKQSAPQDQIHVLLVEDNLINQRVLANQLRSKGCVVNIANHGIEALEFLLKTPYHDTTATVTGNSSNKKKVEGAESDSESVVDRLDVILMDWEMPIMDGLSAVREIRRMQRVGQIKGHVPVIAVTANVRNEQITEAMEAGMDDVVSKPFRVPELCKRMRGLITQLASP